MYEQNEYFALLVEDDLEDAELIQESIDMIPSPKLVINHVKSVKEGRLLIKENHFDNILTDLNLPDSSGLKTVRTLCADAPKTPIIVLTGLNDNDTGIAALEIGAQDFIVKGRFNESQLLHSIQYAISRKKLEEQLRTDQNLLFNVFNNTPVILYLVGSDKRIAKINDAGTAVNKKRKRNF